MVRQNRGPIAVAFAKKNSERQLVAVTAAQEGRDLGSGIAEIKEVLAKDKSIPPGTIEFGGLFHQQQESFHHLLVVLILAIGSMCISLVFSLLATPVVYRMMGKGKTG